MAIKKKPIKKWKGLRRITVGYRYFNEVGQECDVHGMLIMPDEGRRNVLKALAVGPTSLALLKAEKTFHNKQFEQTQKHFVEASPPIPGTVRQYDATVCWSGACCSTSDYF